jgi:NAD(P)-dependent dehydrogenase (short-subunit alcohol dehydrogenase family)
MQINSGSDLDSLFGLQGKHVLITGSAGLLGASHAEAICMAGGTPILTDLDSSKLHELAHRIATKFNITPICFEMNVTKEESVASVHKSLLDQRVNVDVLINNAARNPKVSGLGLENSSRLENLDLASWQLDLDVSLTGAVICAKVFGTHMSRLGKGSIINIASDLGIMAPDQRLYLKDGLSPEEQSVKPVSYSVTKHGLIGFTKYLATYWPDKGVRSNAISPGGIQAGQDPVFLDRIQKLIPMGRMAKLNEIQGAVVFLASDSSSYMNGANLIIDGGRSVW